ncbi:hypothetical protein CFC21_025603 [Triticum aestivum]|uniref:Terpene synthase n=3 Tax=Triticum TaxID=4564 RepID=A0A9R1PYZ8_TRITD|nr:hypothetical protein CFC21_025603 [Triticum aestivum]VAH52247.1 unnamed protein product [Triticum turgidum subsp. durum]
MAAAPTFFSICSAKPLLHSASPVARNVGRTSRNRGFFRPSPGIYPGWEPASHELLHDFDLQESLANVQALLHQYPMSRRDMLTTVDHLKRLCIDHYFQDEIDSVMDACVDLVHSDDLLDATLSLRLMREAGYYVSADDVLRKFTNDNGDFNHGLTKDIRGMLSLQDMSYLNMGEPSLYKANEFSGKHLRLAIKYLEPSLARYVRRSLDHPYHVSLMQYKARHHLSYLQSLPTRNTSIENLALAEFQIKKLQHQREIQEVKRWDPAAVDSLPSYMISCYRALYTVTNDIAAMVRKEHGLNPITHLKQAWAALFDGFMIEGKWLYTNQAPTSEDYLRNGIVTSGAPLVLLHLFFLLGHDLTEGNNDHMLRIISCTAKIMRLWDDMGSAKDESQEGLDGSYKELYHRENPHGDAEKHMLEMIASEWQDLNRECFSGTKSTLSHTFIGASLNFARMVRVMYGYDDEQRLPILEDYTRMLLF